MSIKMQKHSLAQEERFNRQIGFHPSGKDDAEEFKKCLTHRRGIGNITVSMVVKSKSVEVM